MIDWREIPWTLWAYCALLLLLAISVDSRISGQPVALALVPILMLTWSYWLLRGLRPVWFFSIAVNLLIIPEIIQGTVTWEGYASTVIGLLLLVLPITRCFFADHRAAADG